MAAGRHRGRGRHAARPGPAVLRPDGELVIADAISPFCGIGCIMFALVAAEQFGVDTTPGSGVSSTLAAVSAVLLGVGWLILRTRRGDQLRRRPLAFAVALTVMVAVNPLSYIIGTGITYPATGLLLVIAGVGGLLYDRFWAPAIVIALNVGWVLCAAGYGLPVPAAVFAAQLLKADALALVLGVIRVRTVRRLEQTRQEIHRLGGGGAPPPPAHPPGGGAGG